MRYSSRLFLYAPLVALLVIAAIAMLRWHQLATEWETKLQAANLGKEIVPGVTLHFASESINGFPFNLDVVLDRFVVVVQSTRGPIALHSEHLAVHALTYGRAQQIFEAAGTQILTWTDADGEAHRFVFLPGTMRASAIEKDGRLTRFDLDVSALSSQLFSAVRAQLHFRAVPERNLFDCAVLADDLRAKSGNNVLSHLALEGQMAPAGPLAALLSGHEEWRRALAGWGAANGTFHIHRLEMVSTASHLSAEGILMLDGAHRLSGRLNMHVSDAGQWKPMQLVQSRFTSALQELANSVSGKSREPLSLSLDIHNGAAIASAAGESRSAGAIEPLF